MRETTPITIEMTVNLTIDYGNNVRVNLEKLEQYSDSKKEYSLDTYPTSCGGPYTLLSRTNLERTFEGRLTAVNWANFAKNYIYIILSQSSYKIKYSNFIFTVKVYSKIFTLFSNISNVFTTSSC